MDHWSMRYCCKLQMYVSPQKEQDCRMDHSQIIAPAAQLRRLMTAAHLWEVHQQEASCIEERRSKDGVKRTCC